MFMWRRLKRLVDMQNVIMCNGIIVAVVVVLEWLNRFACTLDVLIAVPLMSCSCFSSHSCISSSLMALQLLSVLKKGGRQDVY